jgi:hypothetical protein
LPRVPGSGSQTFVGRSQTFVGRSQAFVGGSQHFAGRSQHFAGGSQAFAGRSQAFVGRSQHFASRSQHFVSASGRSSPGPFRGRAAAARVETFYRTGVPGPPHGRGGLSPKERGQSALPNTLSLPPVVSDCRRCSHSRLRGDRWLGLRLALNRCPLLRLAAANGLHSLSRQPLAVFPRSPLPFFPLSPFPQSPASPHPAEGRRLHKGLCRRRPAMPPLLGDAEVFGQADDMLVLEQAERGSVRGAWHGYLEPCPMEQAGRG